MLLASERAFLALKLLGAAYLVYLGATALVDAVRRHPRAKPEAPPPPSLTSRTAYRQGLLSNLGNPKVAVFFTSLLPQFVPSGSGSFAALLLLGILFAAMTLVWLSGYAVLVAKAGQLLRRSPARRAFDAVTGLVLVGLGLRLAAEGRSL